MRSFTFIKKIKHIATYFTAIAITVCFSVNVHAATGEIWASKYSVPILASGLGETNIQWAATGTSFTQVWVGASFSSKALFASAGASGSSVATWIQQGVLYKFYLYEASGSLPADTVALLDSLDVFGIQKVQPRVGINRMDLHMQYYGSTSGCDNNPSIPCFDVSKRLAKKSIQDAKYMGMGYLRVAVSDYYGDKWLTDSVKFWADMDEMVNDLNAENIKMVPSLMFNVYQHAQAVNSDMHTLVSNPNSTAYQYAERFIKKFVNRYKNNPVILYWELTNEMNLLSDIDMFTYSGNNPVYTNFSTAEMYAFTKRITAFIRSLDKTHMITSGYAMPRTSAYHLVNKPQWVNGGDWTLDTQPQYSQYLIDSHKYFDIVCIHTYNGNNDNERFGYTGLYNAGMVSLSKQISDAAKKLFYVGEFGDAVPTSFYNPTCQYSQNILDKVQSDTIPFSSPWILEFYQFNTYTATDYEIDPVYTTPLVNKMMSVNIALGNNPVPPVNPDIIKPICVIAFPFTGNSFVEPRDTVYPKASDNSLFINHIELYIDGTYHSSTSTWPFKMPVRTDTLPLCDHRVIARAVDNAGNFTEDTITIYKTGSPCAIANAVHEDKESVSIQLFPNPANNILNVSVTGDKIQSIQVFDAMGKEQHVQQVISTGKASMYTDGLASGIYILKVVGAKGNLIQSFAKY